MTVEEFSNEFDVLLNSAGYSKPLGLAQSPVELDNYEKSILLTEAQEAIVKELYNGGTTGEGFEVTEELRRSLDVLVTTYLPNKYAGTNLPTAITSNYSYFYELPIDILYITYEQVTLKDDSLGCHNNTKANVLPVRQDEINVVLNNPFRGPSYRRVLRVDTGDSIIELISKFKIGGYMIKYLRRPKPIILENLTNEQLSIDLEREEATCELPNILHRPILERAVALAMRRVTSSK
jgi:hypothetical protein